MPVADLARAKEPARAAALLLGATPRPRWSRPLVAVCVLSSMQASVLVGPRIYHAMAIDGLFFAPLGKLHARTHVPRRGTRGAGGHLDGAPASADGFDQLVSFTMSAIIGFSTLTVAAVIVLRIRRPDAERAFRVPGYPWVPVLFVAVNVWMLWNVLTFSESSPRRGSSRPRHRRDGHSGLRRVPRARAPSRSS